MVNYRYIRDRIAGFTMYTLALTSLVLVVGIAMGLYLKSGKIFETYELKELIFSNNWRPMKGEFGFWPFIMGTVWVTGVAIVLALPFALLTAMFLTEFAKSYVKKYVFPALDILAGLPSVVYGVWGTLLIIPWISDKFAPLFVEYNTGYTVLAGGIVLGVMILPLLVSLFVEIFLSIPKDLRESSWSLGATRWQTTKWVVLRKAFPGIIASVVLAISRALGETIAVLMVCGNGTKVPTTILDACSPIPALIANNFGEMMSLPLYEAALMFAAFLLFLVVLFFNLISRIILYRVEKTFM